MTKSNVGHGLHDAKPLKPLFGLDGEAFTVKTPMDRGEPLSGLRFKRMDMCKTVGAQDAFMVS
jgi:hypothetical protein